MVPWLGYFCPVYGKTESIITEQHEETRGALHLQCDRKQGQRGKAQEQEKNIFQSRQSADKN